MAKLHTYYITNARNELKYSYTGLSEETFQSIQEAINKARTSDDFDDEEYDNESDDESDDEEYDDEYDDDDRRRG